VSPKSADGNEASKKQRRVLQDYQQKGKRFIPSFLEKLPLEETTWLNDRLPELVWIALLQHVFGVQTGTILACDIAAAAGRCDQTSKMMFTSVSDYATLSPDSKQCIREALWAEATLQKVQRGLAALSNHYENFPMAFLVGQSNAREEIQGSTLADLKETINAIADRTSRAATIAQATAINIAITNDKLKVAPGLSLGNLDAVEDYPLTDESRMVAASIRSTTMVILGRETPSDWRTSFWTQGRALEPCEVSQ